MSRKAKRYHPPSKKKKLDSDYEIHRRTGRRKGEKNRKLKDRYGGKRK